MRIVRRSPSLSTNCEPRRNVDLHTCVRNCFKEQLNNVLTKELAAQSFVHLSVALQFPESAQVVGRSLKQFALCCSGCQGCRWLQNWFRSERRQLSVVYWRLIRSCLRKSSPFTRTTIWTNECANNPIVCSLPYFSQFLQQSASVSLLVSTISKQRLPLQGGEEKRAFAG